MIKTKERHASHGTSYPFVSIITVVYNGEKYLEQTILSVINQSYSNKEYIIIDGGSSDNTCEIIKKYEDKIDCWISEPDKGIYDAINKGISLSNGDLIGIVNSDDWLEPEILGVIAEYCKKNTEIDVFHGILRFIKDDNEYMIRGSSYKAFSAGMFEHPTFFIKREVYNTYGLYSLDYRSASDLELIYRLYSKQVKFLLLPIIISNFRIGGISDSYIGLNETILIRRKFKFLNKRKYLFEKIKLFLKKHFS